MNYKPKTLSQVILESLILAQSERWRRGLGMQVERFLSDFYWSACTKVKDWR